MRLPRNVYLWYAITFFSNASFTLPIWVLFNTHTLGLSNSQAYLLDMLPYIISAFAEIPTGSFADKYGRVKVFRIGTALTILAVASYLVFRDFGVLLALQALGGLGMALQSGCLEAVVHDSLAGPQGEAIYARAHGHKMALLYISRVLTVLPGGLLFTFNPRLPFVLLTGTYAVTLILSFWIRDTRQEKATIASHYEHIRETVRQLRAKQALLRIWALMAVFMFLSEALFALFQPYFSFMQVNIGQFGLFYALVSLLSAVGSLSVARLLQRYGALPLIVAMLASAAFGYGFFTLQQPWLAYVAVIPIALSFGLTMTILNTSVQQVVSSRHQATALSISSFLFTLIMAAGTLGLGISLDHWSMPVILHVGTLLAVTAAAVALVLVVYRFWRAEPRMTA